MNKQVAPYVELIESFTQANINVVDFEERFLNQYKHDPAAWSEDEFAILDELFGAVDAFCADPQLRDENDLDEEQLRDACKTALCKLRALGVADTIA